MIGSNNISSYENNDNDNDDDNNKTNNHAKHQSLRSRLGAPGQPLSSGLLLEAISYTYIYIYIYT